MKGGDDRHGDGRVDNNGKVDNEKHSLYEGNFTYHLTHLPRPKIVPAPIRASSHRREGDIPDNLGRPEERKRLEEDEAGDFAGRAA